MLGHIVSLYIFLFIIGYSPFVTTYRRLLGHYRAMGYSSWTTELWHQSSLKNTCQGLFILQGNFHTLRILLVGKYKIRNFKRTGLLGGDLPLRIGLVQLMMSRKFVVLYYCLTRNLESWFFPESLFKTNAPKTYSTL